jgi:hypothetical protein
MTKEELKEVLVNPSENSRGDHFICDCPYCGKSKHLYVNFIKAFRQNSKRKFVPSWDCKKCGEKGNIYRLLAKLEALHIIKDRLINIAKKLDPGLILADDEEVDWLAPAKNLKLPLGFKRIYSDPYLEGRGFTEYEFQKYKIGETKVYHRLENYAIVEIDVGGECKGYVARIKLNGKQVKHLEQKTGRKVLRYRNSNASEFTKLLMGIDEVNYFTETVGLVEGYFDKVRTDQALQLDYRDEIKCLATFGKDISFYQIMQLVEKGVKRLVIMQDPDAIRVTKRLSNLYEPFFEEVLVSPILGDNDLGDSTDREVKKYFDSAIPPYKFNFAISSSLLKK